MYGPATRNPNASLSFYFLLTIILWKCKHLCRQFSTKMWINHTEKGLAYFNCLKEDYVKHFEFIDHFIQGMYQVV